MVIIIHNKVVSIYMQEHWAMGVMISIIATHLDDGSRDGWELNEGCSLGRCDGSAV